MKMKFNAGTDPHQTSVGWWRTFAAGILAVSILGFAVMAEGKKPVKPPPDPDPEPPELTEGGLIYCMGFDAYMYEIDLDAGSRIPLFLCEFDGWQSEYEASELNHNGRWFAVDDLAPGEYPISSTRVQPTEYRAIYAIDPSGTKYQLTSDPCLEPTTMQGSAKPRWVNNDTEIWFLARRLHEETGEWLENSSGVYRIIVDFPEEGGIQVSSPATLISNSDVFEGNIVTGNWPITDLYAFTRFDVSADGKTMFFTRGNQEGGGLDLGLYKVDLLTGVSKSIWEEEDSDWNSTEYHDLQAAILGEQSWDTLIRIQDDGTDPFLLAESDNRNNLSPWTSVWSPLGEYVTCVKRVKIGKSYISRLQIISSADGTVVATIFEGSDIFHVLGWRPQP